MSLPRASSWRVLNVAALKITSLALRARASKRYQYLPPALTLPSVAAKLIDPYLGTRYDRFASVTSSCLGSVIETYL